VAHERVEELIAALRGTEQRHIQQVLSRFAMDPGPAPLAPLRPAIDRCFAPDSVEDVLETLGAEVTAGGEWAGWAEETRAGLSTKSPTSLKITLRQLQIGQDYNVEAALVLEYRLTQHVMAAHDFYEGVRAMLIDKDQRPRWRPATLAEVETDMVEGYFRSIGERELRFDRGR
jgi:enoyl-CoA hydratase